MAVTAKGGGAGEPDAFQRAADLLGRAGFPVIGGLFTDIAGAAAALALAEKLGGVIDHAAGKGLMRTSGIMRETGASPASFGEVRNRADVVVLVGKGPLQREPDLVHQLFPKDPGLPRPGDNKRELILLGSDKAKGPDYVPVTAIHGNAALPDLVAMLAASVRKGRIEACDKQLRSQLDDLAEHLREAAFAVFVYDPAELTEPVLHTILEMARHLSVTTRASVLSLAAPGNGDGVNLCATWTCGLPVRTSFARAVPDHNAWLYATDRLIESGEADALVWIDALESDSARPPQGASTVVLSSNGAIDTARYDIMIEVACAGRDHDAALYLSPISGIGMVKAAKPDSDKPTVAAVLTRIAELIDEREAA